jgi:CBS domain-containing protein
MNTKPIYLKFNTPDSAATSTVHPQPPVTVGELMTPHPIVIFEGSTIDDCVRLLEESEVGGLPVVDADGLLVGVISESDIVRAQATEYLWNRWSRLRVRHLMHAPVLTADSAMPMVEAATLMEQAHVHRLVVLGDDQARPIGVVSTSDLVRALAHRSRDD